MVPGAVSSSSMRDARSSAATESFPATGISDGSSDVTKDSMMVGSSVSGSTVCAVPAYAMSAVFAPLRKASRSVIFCAARSSREG